MNNERRNYRIKIGDAGEGRRAALIWRPSGELLSIDPPPTIEAHESEDVLSAKAKHLIACDQRMIELGLPVELSGRHVREAQMRVPNARNHAEGLIGHAISDADWKLFGPWLEQIWSKGGR